MTSYDVIVTLRLPEFTVKRAVSSKSCCKFAFVFLIEDGLKSSVATTTLV